MTSSFALRWFGLATACAALAACSSQVDPEYRGEPLAVISGAVSADEVGVEGLVPVLGWYNFGTADEDGPDPTPVLLHEVEVDGEFPNRFTMRVYDMPPKGALAPPGHGEPAAGIAMIFAADPDADWNEGFGGAEGDKYPDWLAGAAINYMLLYVDGDTRDDGPAAARFGRPLKKGYHLMEAREYTAEERDAHAQCEIEAATRALAAYNEENGTDYESEFDLSDDEYEVYSEFESRESAVCGGRVSMEIVPSGLDHPVKLQIGRDFEFLDWT